MKTTLITGGSSGIGAALAKRLVADGQAVAVTGRDKARLARIPGVLHLPGDSTDYDAVLDAVTATVKEYGRLDHVVASAGFATHDRLTETDPDRLRDMILTNVLGPALLVKAALPALRETRGRIVLVGSVAGFIHSPGNMYSVTKWAVTALAENTRMLVTGDGVGVTLIAPGRVDTPFWPDGPPAGPALSGDDIAGTIAWGLAQPPGVDVNTVVVRPTGQPT
ncbi:SDR family oxidoreductase [Rhizohabitans arisaemae]|uniref:SDR family oxidoreductase n=1 Tax=Rhizohabitans arisaemae TaxID=2720610 RepID=UPI0024B0B1C1|nr:SDR family NAD(P)-dependent oxidoreductase [Rhizohabitans arisaemae]